MLIKKIVADKYLKLLRSKGEEGLYKSAVGNGIILSVRLKNPDVELLNMADGFFALYRRGGKNSEDYFLIGKALRRAAHALYRQFLRMDKNKAVNRRFLNMVQ